MKGFMGAVKWETILSLKTYASYKIGLLMDMLVFTGTFIAIYMFGTNNTFAAFYETDGVQGGVLVIIGYIFWQNASAALGYCTGAISNETARGIFEVRLQSKYPLEMIMFSQLLSASVIHVVTYAGIILFGEIMIGFSIKDIGFIFLAILVSYITIVGMYGMGLLFAGIALIEKRVGSFIIIIQTILLFVSNTLSPSRSEAVLLIPFTSGIELVRKLYMHQNDIALLTVLYIVINGLWFVVGRIVFRKFMMYERENGSFENY